jgi:hypothetical protein
MKTSSVLLQPMKFSSILFSWSSSGPCFALRSKLPEVFAAELRHGTGTTLMAHDRCGSHTILLDQIIGECQRGAE